MTRRQQAGVKPAGPRDERGSGAEDELLLEEIVSELPPQAEAATAPSSPRSVEAPPATSVEVARLEAALRNAPNRDEVARVALRLARRYARAAALFVVHRGVVAGLRAEAEGSERPIGGILVPAAGGRLFGEPLATGQPFRCETAADPVDARILRGMGRGDAKERIVVPVAIGGRVVNLLYADNGPEPLAETSAAALRALGAGVAAAYERLIVARKRSGC